MARYGVQVIGRGRQCYVVANIPGDSGYRKGPMSEEEAVELAESMAAELAEVARPRVPEFHPGEQLVASKTVRVVAIASAVVVVAAFVALSIWRW